MSSGVTYVIIVAVENYNDSVDFPKVDYASKDAQNLIEAMKQLGYDEEDFVILLNEKATRATVIQKVKKISDRALENDRIIFYFAGHGFYENGDNLLGSVDALKTAKQDTCVPLNHILGLLKKSASKHKILFLDCCHSGFEAGEHIRDGEDNFEADELIYQFSKEEYCIGFCSCKTHQTSVSHPKLKNGVWTHFLIKALTGEAKGLYKEGLLFSDALQSYLKQETTEFVKLNTTERKDQTPIKFGSETDKFIIADINPILDARIIASKTTGLSFTNISLLNEEFDSVKFLPGFQKGFHKVPNYIGHKPDTFVKERGQKIIEDEISSVSEDIRKRLGYKRREIRAGSDLGGGSIETPDFDYSITISQSLRNAEEYIIVRKLENFKNSSIVDNPDFNYIFSYHFDNLVFDLNKRIDVAALIDTIEAMGNDSLIKVDYDPSDTSVCYVSVKGLTNTMVVTMHTLNVAMNDKASPENLINAFKETYKVLLASPELKMLE